MCLGVAQELGNGSLVKQQVGTNAMGGKEVGEEEARGASADDDRIMDEWFYFLGGGGGIRLFGGGAGLIIPRPAGRRQSG